MRPNWIVNVLMFIEELIRIVMGLGLIIAPLVPISDMLDEPYCEIAKDDASVIPNENPTFQVCAILIFFVRAFGVFNVSYGLLLEVGRRQLHYPNNRTGSFIIVAMITHLTGLILEIFLKPLNTTNIFAAIWHVSYAFLYSACIYVYS
jgi:hypothetical protein